MKLALIGAVHSTLLTLQKLIQHGMTPHRVYGYEPDDTSQVSGYASLRAPCIEHGVAYTPFRKINAHAEEIAAAGYDLIFVIGLSQLVSEAIIASARMGCIGFHPTCLPKGRGRAPIAWLVLEENVGASTLFLIDREADAGPVFRQVPFAILPEDDAGTIEAKALQALASALDDWLPALKRGEWDPLPQDERLVTEYGRRAPEDGWIDWHRDAREIDRLIKASTRPHPGAFTFSGARRLFIWQSTIETGLAIKGVPGRILKMTSDGRALVQARNGLLWINDYSFGHDAAWQEDGLRVGMRLGYCPENEIHALRRELDLIKGRLGL
ncbi:MAG TPA: formyltransferase family protein [Noviherbaspirillum sp.]|uniref:methionyl-tRNA formyltransferase n=1 Tax=Noviherbaspirillum sp. TaxID=1926288 RepID=UPI002B49062D|nr:formyltransferase family protein [Noviherbaspirillum sp.]HJV84468.1 formyltransferase family protein [Noviherbaspirillum sp.]